MNASHPSAQEESIPSPLGAGSLDVEDGQSEPPSLYSLYNSGFLESNHRHHRKMKCPQDMVVRTIEGDEENHHHGHGRGDDQAMSLLGKGLVEALLLCDDHQYGIKPAAQVKMTGLA